MGRAFVIGHGGREADEDFTFVPTGRSLSFYSNFDENTLQTVGLAALTIGTIKPAQTIGAGRPVANYELERLEDDEYASALASTSSQTDATPYFVGDGAVPSPAKLCTTPKLCQATKPLHAEECQGLFNLIDEEEILTVACRGVIGERGRGTRDLGGDKGAFFTEVQKRAEKFLADAKTDPAQALAWWESLPDSTKVELRTSHRDVDELIGQWDEAGLFKTPEAVLDARRYIEAYGEETFVDWMLTLDLGQRGIIRHDPVLGEVFDRITGERDRAQYESDRRELLGDEPRAAGDPLTILTVQIDEQATAIAVAVSQWAGDEADDIDAVSQAYQALMGDVASFQSSASDEWASSAASLYAAGAELGMALALHNEQRDAESLQGVAAAVDLLCQWARSLVSA